MAKKFNPGEIDPKAIIAAFREDEPPNRFVQKKEPEAITESQPEPEVKSSVAPSREESRKRRGKENYESLFIHDTGTTARMGKMVYISKEFHDNILSITRVIGNNEITLASYIHNVLEHHFTTYEEDIVELYNKKDKGIFNTKS
jgi:hypothetical protein